MFSRWPIPFPEISYDEAKAARPDVIIATGRSDYPNQVNNVLGFPFIFRGALDVRARAINEAMKLAATRALAALAKEDVPDSVLRAYGISRLQFGPEYIIPKPFDPRVLIWESAAVAEAAMQSGVAQVTVDLDEYREQLQRRLGRTYAVMQNIRIRAKTAPKRIVFSEGEHEKIIRASVRLVEENIARPILLGRPAVIEGKFRELGLGKVKAEIVDPASFHAPFPLCGGVLRATSSLWHHPYGSPRVDAQQQLFRRHDGSHGRCRWLHCRRQSALPRNHASRAANYPNPPGGGPCFRTLCDGDAQRRLLFRGYHRQH